VPTKKEPLAGGRVGIHRDHRNPGFDRMVDLVFQQPGVGDGDQYPGGFALHRFMERLLLGLGIVRVRTREFGAHLELLGCLEQTAERPASMES